MYQPTKMVQYKLIKTIINAASLPKVINNVVVRNYGLPDLIISKWGSVLSSKFWSLLYFFLKIKKKQLTAFPFFVNKQTESQNSTIEDYLQAFMK